tara:strand:- start:426 stop:4610 length:4185 start_codon:yes stop_codon:yes gene_type:complete
MPTFTEAFEAFKTQPENRGKASDEVIADFVRVFKESTGRNLSDFNMNDEVPNFAEQATEQAAAALETPKEEVGLGSYVADVASKATRFVPRMVGMAQGVAETVLSPGSYVEGGAVDRARADYEQMLEQTQDKDFLDNFQANLLDLREGTLHILATASGYSPTAPGQSDKEQGRETGSMLAAGAIGGTAAMVMSPVRSLYGRPGDVLATLLSLRTRARSGDPVARRALQKLEADTGKSGRGTGRNLLSQLGGIEVPGLPGMRQPVKRRPVEVGLETAAERAAMRDRVLRGVDEPPPGSPDAPFAKAPEGDPLTVGDLASSMASGAAAGLPFGVIEPALAAPLARYLWGTAEATPAGARNLAKVRRFFADPAAQALIADEQQVRQLLREPAKMRAIINREGEALARAADEVSENRIGGVRATADEFKFAIDPAEQATYRPSERLSQRLNAKLDDKPLSPLQQQYLDQTRASSRISKEVEIPIPELSPQTAQAMKNIFQNMDELEIAKNKFPEFQVAVFDAMTDGATLLMSEAVRNRLVDFVITKNKLKGKDAVNAAAALQKNLLERFEEAPVSTEMRGPAGAATSQLVMRKPGQLRLPNNQWISLSDALEGTVSSMKPAERAAVRAEVIGRITRQAGEDASKVAFEQALRKETKRNVTQEMDLQIQYGKGNIMAPKYGASLAKETILEGQSLNQALPRGMLPKNVAEGMRGSLPDLVAAAEKRAGRALTRQEQIELRRRLDDQANRIERYEPFTDDTAKFMPDEELRTWPQIEQDVGTMASEAAGKATNVVYVSPGFNATVWWNTLSRRWGGPVFDSLNNFSSLIKANLTVHNPSTHVGNYMSNVGVDSLRLGHSPMRVIFNTTNEARKYLEYKKGKTLSPMDMRTYKAIDYSKLFSSDLVDAELGVMRRVSDSSPYGRFQQAANMLGEPAKKAWKAYDKAMKEGYKWGDQSFKIYEASRTFREIATAIERLDDGEYIRFRTSPTAHTTLVKTGGKIMRGLDEMTPESLDRTIAAASVRRAFDLFVDYTQVPGLLMMMRQLGPLSIASPFVTWFWRVMDFPGKKGLIYRTLIDDPVFVTNNQALTGGALRQSLYTQARRMLMFNGMRQSLNENRELMRQLIKLQGQPYGSGLFYEASNPGYFTYMRMNNTDFFSPGMHTLRVVGSLMARRLEAEDFEDLNKSQKRLVQRMAKGDVAQMKDVFTMAAMAGGPIIEGIYQGIHMRNRYGRPMTSQEWVRQMLPVLFGQLPTKAVDVALQGTGVFDEGSLMSQRFYAQSRDPNEREDFGPWAFRTLSGLGWRDAKAQNRVGWYAKNVRREMERSLAGALKMKLKKLRQLGLHDDADQLVESYQETLKRIRMEMTIIQEESKDFMNALEHSEQLRVSPDSGALEAMEEME